MHEVVVLRLPLTFGRAHQNGWQSTNGDFTLSEDDGHGPALATRMLRGGIWRTAASTVRMRSGRHYAQFTVVEGDDMLFGVIRPHWDVEQRDGSLEREAVSTHVYSRTLTNPPFACD